MRNHLESYGCTLNKGEAQELKERLVADGQIVIDDEENFDRAVIFTCCVIEQTQKVYEAQSEDASATPA